MNLIFSDKTANENNFRFLKSTLNELLYQSGSTVTITSTEERTFFNVNCNDYYYDIIKAEVNDKVAEIIAVNYKYEILRKLIKVSGLNDKEYEILLASLISADFPDDKKFAYDKLKNFNGVAIDGAFNFRMGKLKTKWFDIANCMPKVFVNTQLKEFMGYLLENKKRRVIIDSGKVYDWHYRQLKRSSMLSGEDIKITREVILSNCGEVELMGKIPEDDEYYLKEYFGDKVFFANL